MKYRITREELLQIKQTLLDSGNIALIDAVNNEFFEIGRETLDEGLHDLAVDLARDLPVNNKSIFNNNEFRDKLGWKDKLLLRLRNHFPHHVEGLQLAYSQGPQALVNNIVLKSLELHDDTAITGAAKKTNIHLHPDKTDRLIFDVSYDSFPVISQVHDGAQIGSIPGPVKIQFELIKKNDRWGFQLIDIETDSELIFNILKGQRLTHEMVRAEYTDEAIADKRARDYLIVQCQNQKDRIGKKITQFTENIDKNNISTSTTKFDAAKTQEFGRYINELEKNNFTAVAPDLSQVNDPDLKRNLKKYMAVSQLEATLSEGKVHKKNPKDTLLAFAKQLSDSEKTLTAGNDKLLKKFVIGAFYVVAAVVPPVLLTVLVGQAAYSYYKKGSPKFWKSSTQIFHEKTADVVKPELDELKRRENNSTTLKKSK